MVYSYRYVMKMKSTSDSENPLLRVQFLTAPEEGIAEFERHIRSSMDIESCSREYLCQIDLTKMSILKDVMTEVSIDETV
uniref:Uncharacterized protein n=1 Tax=Dulem virus 209 TaxID=3145686 RepID=A0AAU8B7W4_9VIRU